MSAVAKIVELGAELGATVLGGGVPDPSDTARRLVGIGLDFVPVAELREHLDAAAVARVDAEVDAAMELKLALDKP